MNPSASGLDRPGCMCSSGGPREGRFSFRNLVVFSTSGMKTPGLASTAPPPLRPLHWQAADALGHRRYVQRRSSAMLTIFAVPKPFKGHIGVIHRNAVGSWVRLTDRVILFGDEEGTADIAREAGVRHVPEAACTQLETPL